MPSVGSTEEEDCCEHGEADEQCTNLLGEEIPCVDESGRITGGHGVSLLKCGLWKL